MAKSSSLRLFNAINDSKDLMAIELNMETLYLEYKQKSDPKSTHLSKEDKTNWSKALSGFANSDGGVLVWGVRENESSVLTLRPINKVSRFYENLNNASIGDVSPAVENLEMKILYTDANSDKGIIVCHIPKSDKAPHRAMLSAREYYKRNAAGFYRLEHFDLEDSFGRRQRPYLKLNLEKSEGAKGAKNLSINVENIGREVGMYLGMTFHFHNVELIKVPKLKKLKSIRNSVIYTFDDNELVIHPRRFDYNITSVSYKTPEKSKAYLEVDYYCKRFRLRTTRIAL